MPKKKKVVEPPERKAITLRMPPHLKEEITRAARTHGMTFNQFVIHMYLTFQDIQERKQEREDAKRI